MRIDINTPIITKIDEKKDSKVIKAKKSPASTYVQELVKAEMQGELKRDDSSDAKLISFLEERKKRRAKIRNEAIAKYAHMQEVLAEKPEFKKGSKINLRV